MVFTCCVCGKERDFETEFSSTLVTREGEYFRYCVSCRKPNKGFPDVYWDGKPEENLADDPNTGRPRIFSSKGEKAAYLREKGLAEAGDRVGGAPFQQQGSGSQLPHPDSRHEVKEALHKVKQMGRDYRKREYRRILHEANRPM